MNSVVQSECLLGGSQSSTRLSDYQHAEHSHIRDVLEGVTQAVRKVISRIDAPIGASSMMRFAENPVGDDIPHCRI